MTGSEITCCFKKSISKVPEDDSDGRKRKVTLGTKIKNKIQCPFKITYSLMHYNRPKRNPIFYKVRIKTPYFHHSHQLSAKFYRRGLETSKVHNKINLPSLNHVLAMLKVNPRLNSTEFRALLYEIIPIGTEITSVYMDNLRRRAALFHAKNPDSVSIGEDNARFVLGKHDMNEKLYYDITDPLIRTNFNKMYRNIMHNDPDSWSALAFLQESKKELPNFDYEIHYGHDNKPDGIMYMTSQMKNNLIRFGDIFFLDAQKRAFNQIGWPYIGIVLRNHMNEICVCCEAIVLGETIAMYVWIIKTMCKLVPQWNLSKIRIIFGDGFITPTLLRDLNIEQSCILHGDYYHLLNEIWPSVENFGKRLHTLIKDDLKLMISSKTILEWELGYVRARVQLLGYPREISLLDEIHSKPIYYSGYYIKSVICNLKCLGSVNAEQNHASNVRHLGKGSAWSLGKEITELIKRQQQHCLKTKTSENNWWFESNYTKVLVNGNIGEQDQLAKETLAQWPWINIWKKEFKCFCTLH